MEIRKLKEEKLFQIGTIGNGYSLKLEPSKPIFYIGFMNQAKYIELNTSRKTLLDIIEAFNVIADITGKELKVNENKVDTSNTKSI